MASSPPQFPMAALGALILPLLVGSTQALAQDSSTAQRPNIVVFLVDDMGWQDTSVAFWERPTAFNGFYKTPSMERLARSGARFTQAYAAAVCSPTRTSIMTGQSPARHRVTQWTLRPGQDPSGHTERLSSPAGWRMSGLQPGDVTLPGLLREVGYRTIHVGKAHWGAQGTPGSDPTQLGFDVNIAGHAAGAPGSYSGTTRFAGNRDPAQDIWAVPGLERYHGLPIHLSDALTVEALGAVDTAIDLKKPFYLYMAHYAVHTPIQAHEPYAQAYRDGGTDEKESRYASLIQGMDASLGALLAHLERRGVAEDTLILFSSDNGGLTVSSRGRDARGNGLGSHNWPLREGKGSAYEGGTRVPQLLSWAKPDPGHPLQARLPIQAGAAIEAVTISEDIFPSVLHWAGAALPPGYVLDGVDLTPLVTGKGGHQFERPLVFHYPHVWGPKGAGYQPHSAIRLGVHKAIYFYEPKRWELYDLSADIGEEQDLAQAQPERLDQLAHRLQDELRLRGAQWPRLRSNDQPEPLELPR